MPRPTSTVPPDGTPIDESIAEPPAAVIENAPIAEEAAFDPAPADLEFAPEGDGFESELHAALAKLDPGATITVESKGYSVKSGGMHSRFGHGPTIEAAVFDLFHPSQLPTT